MKSRPLCAVLPILLAVSATNAQVVAPNRDFYNRGGVALYNPEIDVINSGAVLEATPTVSRDRKYVTIATAPRVTQLVRIEKFPVARVGGWVGAARSIGSRVANANNPGGILQRTGMTRLAALDF